jgi:hypothetical protein
MCGKLYIALNRLEWVQQCTIFPLKFEITDRICYVGSQVIDSGQQRSNSCSASQEIMEPKV